MDEGEPRWTHYGLLYGWVPVKVADVRTDCPTVASRWWLLGWLLPVADVMFSLCVTFMEQVNPEYEPEFGILLTSEYDD